MRRYSLVEVLLYVILLKKPSSPTNKRSATIFFYKHKQIVEVSKTNNAKRQNPAADPTINVNFRQKQRLADRRS